MEKDKDTDQYSPKNKTHLKRLAQIPGDASSDDEILAKREETSVSLGSLEGDSLNPIKKKLKLEGSLEAGYELKTKLPLPKDEYGNFNPVKQEEAGPTLNIKLEDSYSQYSNQGNFEKPGSNPPNSQDEDSNSDNSNMDGSYYGDYPPYQPTSLDQEQELAR
jgi:hypothetical protein